MSDIKYIIAGGGGGDDDDGEHTRFGCLVMVRYAVTGVVTVLTIGVIALSIHAVLRSENMGLSVNKGYIGADTLWSHTLHTSSQNKVAEPATAAAKAMLSHRRGLLQPASLQSEEATTVDDNLATGFQQVSSSSALPKDCFLGCSVRNRDEPTQVTFKKADRTNLRVILVASNPGGRTRIDCNGTRVSLFDMASPYQQIGNMTLGNFTVPPHTTITLLKRLSDTNTSYIWENYPLATRFSVQVRVTSSVTSYPNPLAKKGKTVQQNYTCQPVTIGPIEDEAIYASDDHVHCTASSLG